MWSSKVKAQGAAQKMKKCCLGGVYLYRGVLPAIYVILAAPLLLVQLALSSHGNGKIEEVPCSGWSAHSPPILQLVW